MRIGELAKTSGVAAHTIRFYESKGILTKAKRGANGYREYGDDALQSLSRIQCAQRLGFSLDDMMSMLLGSSPEQGVDHDKMLTQLDARLIEVDQLLSQLTTQRLELLAFKDQLQATWAQGECMGVDEMKEVASSLA